MHFLREDDRYCTQGYSLLRIHNEYGPLGVAEHFQRLTVNVQVNLLVCASNRQNGLVANHPPNRKSLKVATHSNTSIFRAGRYFYVPIRICNEVYQSALLTKLRERHSGYRRPRSGKRHHQEHRKVFHVIAYLRRPNGYTS